MKQQSHEFEQLKNRQINKIPISNCNKDTNS